MIRITQIAARPLKQKVVIRILAIVFALFLAGVLLSLMGYNPFSVYFSMLEGGLGNSYRIRETLVRTIPLALASLGIGLSFRMRFWNIGGEGQIMMGAFAASWVALSFPEVSRPLLLLYMFLASVLGGGLWALIPAVFKIRYKANETILTLMMNYVALKWITYLQYVSWRDEEAFGYPKIPNFVKNAQLPDLFGIHIGLLLLPVMVILLFLVIKYTKIGYEIRVIGEREETARYAGMNVPLIIAGTLFVSGAICGLVGMVQVSGVNNTLSVDVSNGIGYTAIIISWLAQLNAFTILIASFFFAVMVEGGSFIQTVYHIPQAAADILQGLILFSVLGSEFFIRYRISFRSLRNEGSREKGRENELKSADEMESL